MSLLEFCRQTTTAEPVKVGSTRLTPEARAWIVRLPFGGLVWHRPVAVRVEGDGAVRRIPVRDLTGAVFLGLLGLTLVSSAVLAASALLSRRRP